MWALCAKEIMKSIAVFLLLFSPACLCCSFPEQSDLERFNNARAVFHAKIIGTELGVETHDGNETEVVFVTYKLIESFKGTQESTGIVKEIPFSPGNCMLGLLTGLEYIIYLEEHDFVTIPSGSWGFFNRKGNHVAPKLKELRELANNGK